MLVPRAHEETEEQTATRCLQEALTTAGVAVETTTGEVGRHETVTSGHFPGLFGWGNSTPPQHQPYRLEDASGELWKEGAPAAEEEPTTAPSEPID